MPKTISKVPKYIVTWEENTRQPNPYAHPDTFSRIEPESIMVTENHFAFIHDDVALINFIEDSPRRYRSNIQYFCIEKQVFPKLKSVLQLEI